MSVESASLEQLRVHMEYMRETVKVLHNRLDALPTAAQIEELRREIDEIKIETEKQSELMRTLVNLERFAKWFAAIAGMIAAGYGLWRAFKG